MSIIIYTLVIAVTLVENDEWARVCLQIRRVISCLGYIGR